MTRWALVSIALWAMAWRARSAALPDTAVDRCLAVQFAAAFPPNEPGGGLPDGSAMDEEGFVWNCRWGGKGILRVARNGEVVEKMEMPVTNITNCAFGGDDGRTLFVTTASMGAEPEEFAGGLFAIQVPVRGAPVGKFQISAEWAARLERRA